MDANCCQRMCHFSLSLPISLKPVGGIPSHLGHTTFGKKELKETNKQQERQISEFQEGLKQAQHRIDSVYAYERKVDANQQRYETYTRKYNLVIISGAEEKEHENIDRAVVRLSSEHLQVYVGTADFDKVHRYGRSWNGKPRPVIAKCFSLAVRDSIMQNAKKLAGTGIFINEDLPEDARLQRGELRTVVTRQTPGPHRYDEGGHRQH